MISRSLGLSLFLSALAAVPALGRESQSTSSPQPPAAAYPNSTDGLQNLIGDILQAARSKDSAKETELIRSLLMPVNSTWFTDEYGPGFGASLAATYRRATPELEQEIRTVYEGDAQRGWISPKILVYKDPEQVNAPIDHFLNCMNQIVPLYQTVFQGASPSVYMSLKPGEKGKPTGGDVPGYFVYDQGGFRFIPQNILMKLPNERPVRIHLGMNIMQSKVTNRVYPPYPQEALKKHIGGKVVVRLDLDRDGKIRDAKVMEGDPILSQALLDSVEQWQFEPTRLDGDPVEVEVDVEMIFEMN